MALNKTQKKVIGICVIVVVLMGLCPPWVYTFKAKSTYSEESAGYHLIFSPPSLQFEVIPIKQDSNRLTPREAMRLGSDPNKNKIRKPYYTRASYSKGTRLDYGRLFIQWFIVLLSGASIVFFLKKDEPAGPATETTAQQPKTVKTKLTEK